MRKPRWWWRWASKSAWRAAALAPCFRLRCPATQSHPAWRRGYMTTGRASTCPARSACAWPAAAPGPPSSRRGPSPTCPLTRTRRHRRRGCSPRAPPPAPLRRRRRVTGRQQPVATTPVPPSPSTGRGSRAAALRGCARPARSLPQPQTRGTASRQALPKGSGPPPTAPNPPRAQLLPSTSRRRANPHLPAPQPPRRRQPPAPAPPRWAGRAGAAPGALTPPPPCRPHPHAPRARQRPRRGCLPGRWRDRAAPCLARRAPLAPVAPVARVP